MSKNVNRKTAAKGKIVRRLGSNIFGNAKYDKLLSKKATPPGGAPRRRAKQSIYGLQLQEKQKIRLAYGISEKQLRAVYDAAKKMEGVTGSNMLVILGAVVAASGIVTRQAARHVVEEKLGKKKPQFLPMNIKALQAGFDFVDNFEKK